MLTSSGLVNADHYLIELSYGKSVCIEICGSSDYMHHGIVGINKVRNSSILVPFLLKNSTTVMMWENL